MVAARKLQRCYMIETEYYLKNKPSLSFLNVIHTHTPLKTQHAARPLHHTETYSSPYPYLRHDPCDLISIVLFTMTPRKTT